MQKLGLCSAHISIWFAREEKYEIRPKYEIQPIICLCSQNRRQSGQADPRRQRGWPPIFIQPCLQHFHSFIYWRQYAQISIQIYCFPMRFLPPICLHFLCHSLDLRPLPRTQDRIAIWSAIPTCLCLGAAGAGAASWRRKKFQFSSFWSLTSFWVHFLVFLDSPPFWGHPHALLGQVGCRSTAAHQCLP